MSTDPNICVIAFDVFSLIFFLFQGKLAVNRRIKQSGLLFFLLAFLLFLLLNCLSVVCFLASVPHLPIFLFVEGEGCFFGNVW
jgi:hypothetical protein